ncbi:hypothetical protein IE077_002226 [Cardiosporidium cionae]|uniref:Domain of unknown function at the cortex 1 domain-containing protein n=1 Tax=Cardiosporidium cionae TaxID=476202 RepID=A0ABQ7JFV9_9APIC|nr:hypothetical protein IE077_002226 [Cardiosporidium cionae]|eukprot:KAF8822891.1 hypothetical protein IE077_002226 [Cardiosporidium cionae]
MHSKSRNQLETKCFIPSAQRSDPISANNEATMCCSAVDKDKNSTQDGKGAGDSSASKILRSSSNPKALNEGFKDNERSLTYRRSVSLNSVEPIYFENEYFEGRFLLLLRPQSLENFKYRHIFEKRKRIFEIQVQGRFKKKPASIVFFGVEMEKKLKLDILSNGIAHTVLAFMSNLSSGRLLKYSFGQEAKKVAAVKQQTPFFAATKFFRQSSLHGKKNTESEEILSTENAVEPSELEILPHLVYPLIASADLLIASKVCETHKNDFRFRPPNSTDPQNSFISAGQDSTRHACGCDVLPVLGEVIHESESQIEERKCILSHGSPVSRSEWRLFGRSKSSLEVEEKKSHLQAHSNPMDYFSTDFVYTFTYGSMYLNLLEWCVVGIPVFRSIDLSRFTLSQSINFVAYDVHSSDGADENEKRSHGDKSSKNSPLLEDIPRRVARNLEAPHSVANKRYYVRVSCIRE